MPPFPPIPADLDLVEAVSTLSQRSFVLVSPRASDFAALGRVVGGATYIVCEADPGSRQDAGEGDGRNDTLERRLGERRMWDNRSLGELVDLGWPDGAILPYAADERWEHVARVRGLPYLAIDSEMERRLDDKISMRASFDDLGLDAIPSAVLESGDLDHRRLTGRFGVPYVLQRRYGSAGTGTHVVSTPRDLETVVRRSLETVWLASRHMGNTVVNVHALVAPAGVRVGPPSLQLAGVPGLTGTGSVQYAGSDFAAAARLAPGQRAAVRYCAERVGRHLSELGYVGIFGLDLVSDGTDVWPLELNPRCQASTALLTEAELHDGQVPLLYRHVLSHFGWPSPALLGGDEVPDIGGSQLVLRWQGELKRVEPTLCPGVYRLVGGGRLVYCRSGLRLSDCASDEVLLSGIPVAGCRVLPGVPVVRVAAWESVAGVDSGALNAFGSGLRDAVSVEVARW